MNFKMEFALLCLTALDSRESENHSLFSYCITLDSNFGSLEERGTNVIKRVGSIHVS